jgi:hypothetical protein
MTDNEEEEEIMADIQQNPNVNNNNDTFQRKLPELLQQLHSSLPDVILQALIVIRKQLSDETNPPIQLVLDTPGMLTRLVRLMDIATTDKMKFEVCFSPP